MGTANPSEDVKALFRRFGGEVGTYQEVVRERNAESSRAKWPMLGNIQPLQALNAPSVNQSVRVADTRPPALDVPHPAEHLSPAPHLVAVSHPPAGAGSSFLSGRGTRSVEFHAPAPEAHPQPVVTPPPERRRSLFASKVSAPAEVRQEQPTPVAADTHTLGQLFGRLAGQAPAPERTSNLFSRKRSK